MEKHKVQVDTTSCLACCGCISVCPQDAISWTSHKARINKEHCNGCGICIKICPIGAINKQEV